jgi:hypothetical protein
LAKIFCLPKSGTVLTEFDKRDMLSDWAIKKAPNLAGAEVHLPELAPGVIFQITVGLRNRRL